MESKIRIRIGSVEIDYEGSEAFLKNDLLEMLHQVLELKRDSADPFEEDGFAKPPQKDGVHKLQLSTNSISAKLNVKSGTDLAVAAAAHLTFVKSQKVFSRQDILKEMKSASSYFKETYRKNLSNTLRTLIKTKLNEPSTSKYALTAAAEKELRLKLAED